VFDAGGIDRKRMTGGKAIYLPLSDEEDCLLKDKRRIPRKRRPYLMVLLISTLLMFVFGIGMIMQEKGEESIIAVMDRKSTSPSSSPPPPLILVSIDGFRFDYLKRGLTPNLKKICKSGIYGPMKPQFPSYTFPNHYSLVTGLYPESHGIVGNAFYDPKLDDYFSYTNQENVRESKWWMAEPIWNAVQRFGMKSATMFWPGSESRILGRGPNYYAEYNENVPTEARVDQVLKWLE
jgi:predicted AlkP superfamily pyrophosphatase or phosphodiesterase